MRDSSGVPLPNAVAHFGVVQGDAAVSTETAVTNSNGQASVTLTAASGATGAIEVLAGCKRIAPSRVLRSLSRIRDSGESDDNRADLHANYSYLRGDIELHSESLASGWF